MEKAVFFGSRNIAITDLETTGLFVDRHEIIEIGLVLINQPDLEIIETFEIKVKPANISTASDFALNLNGYNKKDWKNAPDLSEALQQYLNKTKDAIFSAYNVQFDLPFIKQACMKTGLPYSLDYHCIDIPTLVWKSLRESKIERLNLNYVAQYFGLEAEPRVHRALNGAMLAYKVLKKVVPTNKVKQKNLFS